MCREHRREHPFLSPSIILNHFYHYCVYLSDTCTCKTSVPDKAYLIRHTEPISLCMDMLQTCKKDATLDEFAFAFRHTSVFPLHYWLFRIVAARLAVEGNCKAYNNEPLLCTLAKGDSHEGLHLVRCISPKKPPTKACPGLAAFPSMRHPRW